MIGVCYYNGKGVSQDYYQAVSWFRKAAENGNANEMTWVFKGDFGVVKKAVTVQLTVDESVAPEKLAFSLKGVSDNINGGGFYATEAAEGGTKLTGSLNMSAGGFLAGMINPVLEKFLPTMVSELTAAMAAKVQQLEVG